MEEGLNDGAEDVENGGEEGGDGVCDGGHCCGRFPGCSSAWEGGGSLEGWKGYLVFVWGFLELLWVIGNVRCELS